VILIIESPRQSNRRTYTPQFMTPLGAIPGFYVRRTHLGRVTSHHCFKLAAGCHNRRFSNRFELIKSFNALLLPLSLCLTTFLIHLPQRPSNSFDLGRGRVLAHPPPSPAMVRTARAMPEPLPSASTTSTRTVPLVVAAEFDVHVFPSVRTSQQAPHDINQTKAVARAVSVLVPADRLKVKSHKRFHASNTNLGGKSMRRCIALVETTTGDRQLAELMDNPDCCFAWNFQNLWNNRGGDWV